MRKTIELHKKTAVEHGECMAMTVTAAIVPTFTGSKKFIEINKFGSVGGCLEFEGEQAEELVSALNEALDFLQANTVNAG